MATDRAFFNAPCPTDNGRSRRENIADVVGYIGDHLVSLRGAVNANNLIRAQVHFAQIKSWCDVLACDLRESAEDPSEG